MGNGDEKLGDGDVEGMEMCCFRYTQKCGNMQRSTLFYLPMHVVQPFSAHNLHAPNAATNSKLNILTNSHSHDQRSSRLSCPTNQSSPFPPLRPSIPSHFIPVHSTALHSTPAEPAHTTRTPALTSPFNLNSCVLSTPRYTLTFLCSCSQACTDADVTNAVAVPFAVASSD